MIIDDHLIFQKYPESEYPSTLGKYWGWLSLYHANCNSVGVFFVCFQAKRVMESPAQTAVRSPGSVS